MNTFDQSSLPDVISQVWYYKGLLGEAGPILPDGCRDLIFAKKSAASPEWFVTDLFDAPHQTDRVYMEQMIGFRLAPGIKLDTDTLLTKLSTLGSWDEHMICEILQGQAQQDAGVAEILGCIAHERADFSQLPKRLGVSQRTVQRLLQKYTNRSPIYWRQLARMRRAARKVATAENWAEFAFEEGYSDQAHMNREFQRWFGVSPRQFAGNEGFKAQVHSPAFA